MKCPKCGKENTDYWPIEVDGKIIEGGCQDCWETECDKSWWDAVILMNDIISLEDKTEVW